MPALLERIVQKITEVSPIETTVSHVVAGVLESTATRLARSERVEEPAIAVEDAPAG